MTDQQFYQENLIKCLESIKADMNKLDTLITRSEAQAVVDRYLDKAKAINEYERKRNNLIFYHSTDFGIMNI